MSNSLTGSSLRALDDRGFIVLPELVKPEELLDFEQQVASLVAAQLEALQLKPVHEDRFVDVFSVGGRYTGRFYQLFEHLFVFQRITSRIGMELEQAGFFAWSGMKVPLLWPDVRADIPGATDQLLPVHQDYGSMQCERAFRLWIPLRDSNEEYGSMSAYPGTHKQGPVPHDLSDPLKPRIDSNRYRESDKVVFDLPAGDGVLINPLIFHASVPNRSKRTKFTLMIQIQDFATMINPLDMKGGYELLGHVKSVRAAAREARSL